MRATMQMLWATLTALLVLTVPVLAVAAPPPGGPVTVTAELANERAYIGEPLSFQIVVDGTTAVSPPEIPALTGLSMEFVGGQDVSSHMVTIINGRRMDQSTVRYVLQYRVTPLKGGVLKIPAIPVVVGGTTYTTEPKVVAAIEATQTDDFKLRVEVAKTAAFVGEPIAVKITWFIAKQPRSLPAFSMPPAEGAFELLPGPDRRPPGTAANDPRYREIQFMDSAAIATFGQATLDGRQYTTLTFERVLVPRRAGALTLGPLRAAFDVITGRRQRTFFDSPLLDDSVTERQVIGAEPVEVAVEPLPTEGRPANFSGLIGPYSIEASASPTTVNVGDPITLTVTVQGPPPMGLVPPLPLEKQANLAKSFKLPADPVFPRLGPTTAMFSYTIRARSERASEVPPIELSYFDTAARAYRTAMTSAIPLTVRPTTSVTLGGDVAEGRAEAAPAAETRPGGIAPLRRSLGSLASQRFDLAEVMRSPVWIGVVAGPPALYVAAAGLMAVRRRAARDPLAQRRRRALGRTRRRLAQAQRLGSPHATDAVSTAVQGFVADMFGRPDAGLTADECVHLVREAGAASASRLDELLKRCDVARFAGPAAASADRLASEADVVVTGLSRELRGGA